MEVTEPNEHQSPASNNDFQSDMIDISFNQDRSILKRIIQEGTEPLNYVDGDYAQFYLNAVLDPTKSTRDRIRVYFVKFGKPHNFVDLECALKSMKKGEVAEFYLNDGIHSGKNLSEATSNEELINGEEVRSTNETDNENKEKNDLVDNQETNDLTDSKKEKLKGLFLKIEMIGLFEERILKNNDSGILRYRLKEGEGISYPKEGAEINCHLATFALSGERLAERDVVFILGEGSEHDIPRGVELALQHMKLHEKSRFLIKKSYGFKTIPASLQSVMMEDYEELFYEIRLNNFQNAKEVWELSNEERLEASQIFKDKGTKYFKAQKYELAIKFYSKIIHYLGPPENDIFKSTQEERDKLLLAGYLNLAQTYLNLDIPFNVIKNCDFALQLDPNNVKALYRKGLAHMRCKEFDLAVNQFKMILKLEPNNSLAAKSLITCNNQISELKAKEQNTFKNMFQKFAEIDAKREQKARRKQNDVWIELEKEKEFKTPDGDNFSDLPIKMI